MEKYNKIGGWLIIFGIAIPIQVLIHTNYLIRGIQIFLSKNFVSIEANYGIHYTELVRFSSLFFIISNAILLTGIIYSNYLFIKRRLTFTNVFITVNLVSILLSFISEYLTGMISGNSPVYFTSIRLLIVVLIAVIYLKQSNRVKATFIY